MQKERQNLPHGPSNSTQKSKPHPAAPDSQKALDALNEAISEAKKKKAKRTIYREICCCGCPECRIGPFELIEEVVEDDGNEPQAESCR